MSRRKSLPSLGEWIGAGGCRFDGNLLGGELRQLDLDQLVAADRVDAVLAMDDLAATIVAGVDRFQLTVERGFHGEEMLKDECGMLNGAAILDSPR